MLKRTFDAVAASIGLLVLAPLFGLVTVVIRVTSPGPALYRQIRVGQHGVGFEIYKFRTMADGADRDGPTTTENDPRITAIGAVLRKTSIDELPQLINVVRGEMSLVGPRPFILLQERDYEPDDWKLRHTVKPGITGLAQVELRSEGTLETGLACDLDYVANHSLGRDISILVRTAARLLRGGSN